MTDTTWLTATGLAQIVFTLSGFVLFLLNPKSGRKEFIWLGLVLFITLIAEVTGTIGAVIYMKNMNFAYSISVLFTLPLFLIFYKSKISSKAIGGILNFVIVAFVVFALINLFFIQKPTGINSYTGSFLSISMILLSTGYFYILIKELPTETITKLPMFWINTAVLIYYSGTFFQHLAADYLVNVLNDNLINAWTLHNFLGIIYYSMLSFALWLNRSNLLQSSPPPVNTIP